MDWTDKWALLISLVVAAAMIAPWALRSFGAH
jgi:hypothetical protein